MELMRNRRPSPPPDPISALKAVNSGVASAETEGIETGKLGEAMIVDTNDGESKTPVKASKKKKNKKK